MIRRSEREKRTGTNALGQDSTYTVTRFEVEESDVGTSRPNYLGFGHRGYTFKADDVGRSIEVYTEPGWTCWSFC